MEFERSKIWVVSLPSRLGEILGCSLVNLKKEGKPDKGKNRLYRILMSETAYLIWKMRNERRTRDGDDQTGDTINETTRRWNYTSNKRLTIDRALTDSTRFQKKALDDKLVKATWRKCLENEADILDDWFKLRGILVGIAEAPGKAPTLPPRGVPHKSCQAASASRISSWCPFYQLPGENPSTSSAHTTPKKTWVV